MRMVRGGLISLTDLESYLEQILPEYEYYQPGADLTIYRRKFQLLKEKLAAFRRIGENLSCTSNTRRHRLSGTELKNA